MKLHKLLNILVIILLYGCAKSVNGNGANIDEDANGKYGDSKQFNWKAHESNPIIKIRDQLEGAMWNDPAVIKEGSDYIMYLTASFPPPDGPVLPFRAISGDGIKWKIDSKPLLSTGKNEDDFDYAKIETPSIIFFNGLYYMYYTGVPYGGLGGKLSIGYATSKDGISWTKPADNPVLSSSSIFSDWNGFQVAEPGAVVFSSKVYLYFTAVGLIGDGQKPPFVKRVIGLAISDDGSLFGDPIKILEQSDIYPAAAGYQGYSTPSAALHDGKIHLFYDVYKYVPGEKPDEHVQVAIHHSVSSDGKTFVQDNDPIFERISFDWTKREIRAPTVIYDEGKFKMWFSGDDVASRGLWGIGYAALDSPQ